MGYADIRRGSEDMGRQTIKWSFKMPIFVSFARCVKRLHKHDKLTQCCRAFTLALARPIAFLFIH